MRTWVRSQSTYNLSHGDHDSPRRVKPSISFNYVQILNLLKINYENKREENNWSIENFETIQKNIHRKCNHYGVTQHFKTEKDKKIRTRNSISILAVEKHTSNRGVGLKIHWLLDSFSKYYFLNIPANYYFHDFLDFEDIPTFSARSSNATIFLIFLMDPIPKTIFTRIPGGFSNGSGFRTGVSPVSPIPGPILKASWRTPKVHPLCL